MNLANLIESHPADAPALISRGKTTSYGELRDQVGHLRGGLTGIGIEPGDRVVIVCANNWYFVASYLAVLGVGGIAVPLNPLSPVPELQAEVEVVQPRAIIAGPAARRTVTEIDRLRVPDLEHVIVCAGGAPDGAVLLDDLLAVEPTAIVERSDGDLAALVFTSGTAGRPRAARLTHGNLRSNLEQMLTVAADLAPVTDDVGYAVLPFFHIFGLNVALGLALAAGTSVVIEERFDPVESAAAIVEHGVTVVAGAPSMWAAWLAAPSLGHDTFAKVRIATTGAAPTDPDLLVQIRDRFGLEVVEGYGLTEAGPVVTTSIGLPWRPGTVGRPLPGVDVRLIDAEGDDVLVGDPGEIIVGGPNVFDGYWDDPVASEEVLHDGWLLTGDIAVVDDSGVLAIVDRAKDLIIVSGFNVFPAEVEEAIREHHGVEACAVVGIPHPHSGEAVRAYVVPRAGWSLEEDELIEFCAGRLARYKAPSKVTFVDDIPSLPTGKILRRQLRESITSE